MACSFRRLPLHSLVSTIEVMLLVTVTDTYNLAVFSASSESVSLPPLSFFCLLQFLLSVFLLLVLYCLYQACTGGLAVPAIFFLNRQVSCQPSAIRSQLEPRYSSDDFLPVITRILPPRVMPRVSLAVTLTGMGNYNTGVVRSGVPRLQPRRRLY